MADGKSVKPIRTGVFGGSFNPVHTGHVALARRLRDEAALDEVWLMVSPQNPLKAQASLKSDRVRLMLARKALKGVRGVKASDFEFRLPKPSYTWHTLQALEEAYPDRTFVLLIGADNWTVFPRWYRYEDIIRKYEIVIYPRTGYPVDAASLPEGVRLADTPLEDVSSTEIRKRVGAGLSIDGMVPDNILGDVLIAYGK